jgi:hypothetical protein
MNTDRGETVDGVYVPRMLGIVEVNGTDVKTSTGSRITNNKTRVFFRNRETTNGTPPIRQHGYCILEGFFYDPATDTILAEGETPPKTAPSKEKSTVKRSRSVKTQVEEKVEDGETVDEETVDEEIIVDEETGEEGAE